MNIAALRASTFPSQLFCSSLKSKHNIVGSPSESDRDNVTRTEPDQETELGVHI